MSLNFSQLQLSCLTNLIHYFPLSIIINCLTKNTKSYNPQFNYNYTLLHHILILDYLSVLEFSLPNCHQCVAICPHITALPIPSLVPDSFIIFTKSNRISSHFWFIVHLSRNHHTRFPKTILVTHHPVHPIFLYLRLTSNFQNLIQLSITTEYNNSYMLC